MENDELKKDAEEEAEMVFSWIDQWDTENYPSKKSDCKDRITKALLAFHEKHQEGQVLKGDFSDAYVRLQEYTEQLEAKLKHQDERVKELEAKLTKNWNIEQETLAKLGGVINSLEDRNKELEVSIETEKKLVEHWRKEFYDAVLESRKALSFEEIHKVIQEFGNKNNGFIQYPELAQAVLNLFNQRGA